MRILLVDDEKDSRESVSEFLSELGHQIKECDNAGTAYKLLQEKRYPLVITDIRMPGMSGIEFLEKVKKSDLKDTEIIVYTGYGAMNSAILALRLGAFDYLQKPINVTELALLVEKCEAHLALKNENRRLLAKDDKQGVQNKDESSISMTGAGEILVHSKAMQGAMERAFLYHENPDLPVIIEGETGTGKELIAKAIHYGKNGSTLPFVDINCAAISPELFESELFGYEAGAFTGGKPRGEKGKMALCENGTLFLDEIGDLPLSMQPKFLRVLQDHSYFQVGGLKKLAFEARVICATNHNLEMMSEKGLFRKDLFYRLNVGYIKLPPLRERKEDILAIAEFFLRRLSQKKGKRFRSFDPLSKNILLNYEWPGNIRELSNTIERILIHFNEETVRREHLFFLRSQNDEPVLAEQKKPKLDLFNFELPEQNFDLEEFNNEVVLRTLEKFQNNKSSAAKYLNLSRTSFYSRLKNAKKITNDRNDSNS